MFTIITYPTALEYWMTCAERTGNLVSLPENKNCFGISSHFYKQMTFLKLTAPYHIMVPEKENRKKRPDICCHIMPKHLPKKSFIRLSDSLYIICPELCFLLAAQQSSLPELVVKGNDLCGIYRKDESNDYLHSRRHPVTITVQIRRYLAQCKNIKGINKALRAAKYLHDYSNSTMESILAALLALPLCAGGYAIKEFVLNENICLSKASAAFLGRDSCQVDILMKNKKIILEYDSNLAHLTPAKHHSDKKRRSALSTEGYRVISLTAAHFHNRATLDSIMREIRNMLELRTNKKQWDKYEPLRWEVIRRLVSEPEI